MDDLIFISALGVILAHFLGWCFKHLAGERWQMLAVVPLRKIGDTTWQGVNLTYYGFFIATSQLLSLMLLLILLGSMGISKGAAMVAVLMVLAVCVPAARLVAMVVEKKRHTFTIGGASFVGVLVAPWAIMLTDYLFSSPEWFLPTIPTLAAMSIGYTLGEGLGRLGCISYGCCYGKPVSSCNRFIQWLFSRTGCIFHGSTKKVAYEAQLEGERLVPIQAITCIIYCSGSLVGSYLFLKGLFTPALLFTIGLTQLWRIFSETMRADFRGFGTISAYQKMGVLSVIYVLVVVACVPRSSLPSPVIVDGLSIIWNPTILISLQILWFIFFFTFGRSTVTSSVVSFDLIRERL